MGKVSICICLLALANYADLVQFIHARGERSSTGILWDKVTRFPFDPMNKVFSNLALDRFEKCVGPDNIAVRYSTGRLACACTGGGKRRVFAIPNYIHQQLLKPVHSFLADIISRIPMDGTFFSVR